MQRHEHLLFILAEECAEVAQRCSKAARFGLDERQNTPSGSSEMTNAERIHPEMADLIAVYEMLIEEGYIPKVDLRVMMAAKRAKVNKYLDYAEKSCGTLTK